MDIDFSRQGKIYFTVYDGESKNVFDFLMSHSYEYRVSHEEHVINKYGEVITFTSIGNNGIKFGYSYMIVIHDGDKIQVVPK